MYHHKRKQTAFGNLAGNEQEHRAAFYAAFERMKRERDQMLMGGSMEDRKEAAMQVIYYAGQANAAAQGAPKYDPQRVSDGYQVSALMNEAKAFLFGKKKPSVSRSSDGDF